MAKPAAKPDTARTVNLRWSAIAAGLVVSYLLLFGGGVILARLGLSQSMAAMPLVQSVALFVGGYFAGRWAGISGFWNGVAVAVAFIAVWALLNPLYEMQLVRMNGPLALPPMNMGGIILGDLLNLAPAAFGGYLAERKSG